MIRQVVGLLLVQSQLGRFHDLVHRGQVVVYVRSEEGGVVAGDLVLGRVEGGGVSP